MTSVRFTVSADVQRRQAIEWWLEHRPSNPLLLVEEIKSACELLCNAPHAGLRLAKAPGVRRYLLRHTRYHLYYTVESETEIVIHALWHAQKRGGPPLHILSR